VTLTRCVPEFVARRTQRNAEFSAPRVADYPDELPVRWRQMLILLLVLPMFGQYFHYIKALHPLWALSKAFPIITLPLCFFAFRDGASPRVMRQLLLSMLYLLLMPSFMGIPTFDQNFFLGLTSQVKLLPILYFFSFLGLLRLLKPTPSEIAKSFLIWGALLVLVTYVIWLVVPQSAYAVSAKIDASPIFTRDGRGNRVRMAFYFGIIASFYCYRRFFSDKKIKWLLGTIAGFISVIGIIRTRAFVLGMAVTIAINTIRFSKRTARLVMLGVMPLLLVGLVSIPYVATVFDTSSKNGFDVRRYSTEKALAFLALDPVKWIFGVGSITPLDPTGFIRFFNHDFFLADITWVGIVFEFGLIGAALILLIPLRGLWESRDVTTDRAGAFLGALQDYLVYAILISPLYPLTLSPGEYTVILAIFVYERTYYQGYQGRDPRFRYS